MIGQPRLRDKDDTLPEAQDALILPQAVQRLVGIPEPEAEELKLDLTLVVDLLHIIRMISKPEA